MSYERTLISDTNAAIPSQPVPTMREPREIDPYRASKPIPVVEKPSTGQSTINSDIKTSSPEETKAPTEESVTLSPQMAALARKEQKFRQQQLDLKKRSEELELERKELAELKAFKSKLEAKDFSGIENLVKYDEYTNYLIEKEGTLTPEQQAVKKLAEEVETLKTSQKEDIAKRFDAAVNERRNAVKELVQTKPEFARIKKAQAEEAVVKHILDTWEHDGTELPVEVAAKEVEEILLERATKWKALLEDDSQTVPAVEGEKKQLPPLKPQIKTLTNNMAATGDLKRPVKSFQHMSDSERWAEARRRAEEKLKQGIK